jgi:hypothetical protein
MKKPREYMLEQGTRPVYKSSLFRARKLIFMKAKLRNYY